MKLVPSTPVRPALAKRFEAIRTKLFRDMAKSTRRGRMVGFAVLGLVTLLVLIVGGASTECIVRHAVLSGLPVLLAYLESRVARRTQLILGLAGVFSYVGAIANTGGLASPLLISGFPVLVATTIQPEMLRNRVALPVSIVSVLLALAIIGMGQELPAPFDAAGGRPTFSYMVVAGFAALVTAVGTFLIANQVATTYELAAHELAHRREEVFEEGASRARSLEGIAARLAHEVKNPLSAIRALSTHMARSDTSGENHERLRIVASEAERLQSIVDGFLSFSRGLEDLTIAPTAPFETARSLVALLDTSCAEAGVELLLWGDQSLEIQADERKLRQAMINLLLNAIQASSPGSVVRIEVERDTEVEDGVVLRVIDQGEGMSGEVLERIKRPYFSTRDSGSGLGVAIARSLVEQHGGRLRYESHPSRGTTASVFMPAVPTVTAIDLPRPTVERASSLRSTVEIPSAPLVEKGDEAARAG